MTPNELGVGLFQALVGEPETLFESVKEYLNDTAQPEDIFDNEKLEAWARARGFSIDED